MNLTALITRVRSLTSILSTSVLSDAEITDFINEAHTQFCLSADWPFLIHTATVDFNTGSDAAQVSLPFGRSAQRVLDVFAQTQAGEKPWQLFERAQPTIQESSSAYPREFEWNPATNTLRVYPAPSRPFVVRARLVLDPSVMSGGSAQPLLPPAFRHGIAYLASALILEREADTTGRAQSYQARAAGVVEEMRRLLLTSSRSTFTLGGRTSRRRSVRRQVW
jgi:hypothetical protein